jgi:hypothetical protein
VPLTGPKIAAGLCKTNACTPTLPKSLRPRTGGEKAGAAGNFEGNFFSEKRRRPPRGTRGTAS